MRKKIHEGSVQMTKSNLLLMMTVEHLLLMMTVEHLLLMMEDCRKALE